eukprot:m.124944 g.124944  ORF g.124944 m.124944 type:complete len:468 (+) comp17308_c0_seq2:105-1508(+)
MASSNGAKLVTRLSGHHTAAVTGMEYVDSIGNDEDGGVLSIAEDKQLIIWLKRDSGGYWPSVQEELPDKATALCFDKTTRRAYIGLANGTIVAYDVQDDFNAVRYNFSIQAHRGRIAAICIDSARKLLLSCGRDKAVIVTSLADNKQKSIYTMNAWACVMDYDSSTANIFVGDYGGHVHVLKTDKETSKTSVIAVLEGHEGSIRSLVWQRSIGMLFSGSWDNNIIMWDIGHCKGEYFTLRGHKGKVKGLAYLDEHKQLVSAGSDKRLVVWDIGGYDDWVQAPEWQKSDNCQLCERAFIWNVSQMWEEKKLSLERQHHCRYTGKAVCDACSPYRTQIAPMGFEFPVRVCVEAWPDIKEEFKVSRSKAFPLGQNVELMQLVHMDMEPFLLTGSSDGSISVWAIKHGVLEAEGVKAEDFVGDTGDEHVAVSPERSTSGSDKNVVHHATVYSTGGDTSEAGGSLLDQLDDD